MALCGLMGNPALSALFLAKMSEHLSCTSLNEMPRFAGPNQQDAREVRSAPTEG
jgi:hypothetical protein